MWQGQSLVRALSSSPSSLSAEQPSASTSSQGDSSSSISSPSSTSSPSASSSPSSSTGSSPDAEGYRVMYQGFFARPHKRLKVCHSQPCISEAPQSAANQCTLIVAWRGGSLQSGNCTNGHTAACRCRQYGLFSSVKACNSRCQQALIALAGLLNPAAPDTDCCGSPAPVLCVYAVCEPAQHLCILCGCPAHRHLLFSLPNSTRGR